MIFEGSAIFGVSRDGHVHMFGPRPAPEEHFSAATVLARVASRVENPRFRRIAVEAARRLAELSAAEMQGQLTTMMGRRTRL